MSLNNLALVLAAAGRHDEAEPLYRRALAIYEYSLGSNHPQTGNCINNIAELLRVTNRHDEAEPFFNRAIIIMETYYGPSHHSIVLPLSNMALLFSNTARPAEAELLYRRSLAIVLLFQLRCGQVHPCHALFSANYTAHLETLGRTPTQIAAALAGVEAEARSLAGGPP